jgi:cytochrome c556
MGRLATALADALKSGDAGASLAAFGALGRDGCGGCHGKYQRQ